MKSRKWTVWGAALGVLAMTAAAQALSVGDKAPSLKDVTQWMNGEAVDPSAADDKTVYVVEFWATWCGPCRVSIPHLNELHAQYKDKDVVFVGVTSEPEATVKPFMESVPIHYRVALDTKNSTAETYMKDVDGIPHAFLVNKTGEVVWAGHPMAGLDEALKAVVEGTFDPAAMKARQTQQDALMKAYAEGDLDTALKLVDRMAAERPDDLETQMMKAGLLMQAEKMDAFRAHLKQAVEQFKDSAESLNVIAWTLLQAPLPARDLSVAWPAARRAAELTEFKDAAALDTYALAEYLLGRVESAAAWQEKAVAAAKDPEMAQSLRDTLAYYKAALAQRAATEKTEEKPSPPEKPPEPPSPPAEPAAPAEPPPAEGA